MHRPGVPNLPSRRLQYLFVLLRIQAAFCLSLFGAPTNHHVVIRIQQGYITRSTCFQSPASYGRSTSAGWQGIKPLRSSLVEYEGNDADSSTELTRESVPSTIEEAVNTFFFGKFEGPRLVVASVVGLLAWRLYMVPSACQNLSPWDATVFGSMVMLWWLQEHAMHKHLLHSRWDWFGKRIHQEHHERPYLHISIDPAPLMVGWLLTAHVVLRLCLPLPLALSATLGYAIAGLFYEWAHFIAHTGVPFQPTSYWHRMKQHQYVMFIIIFVWPGYVSHSLMPPFAAFVTI